MKYLRGFFATLYLAGCFSNAIAVTADPVEKFVDTYSKMYAELGLGADLELSYVKHIESLLQHTDIARQHDAFDQLDQQLTALDKRSGNPCQQLQLQQIAFELELNQQKLALLDQYLALGKHAVLSDKGLYESSLAKQWYAYLLKAWLTIDTTPETLMAMGHSELKKAIARYRELQVNMGYGGRDKEFAAYLDSAAFSYPDGTTPQADYEMRQSAVYQNLNKLFLPTSITPPQIRKSELGASLLVDGYYEPNEATFYFNKTKNRYSRRNIDWLLLHESTPGHHFQDRYVLEQHGCLIGVPHSFYSAYVEGWGAYVEEFGAQLGLFQTNADALGAVEWDMVRSIRVVLDVGINYFGWTEQQARDYWQSELPMLPTLAEREIARVHKWPVQAITYKQGAVMLRRLRSEAQVRLGSSFDIRAFHDHVLRNGPVPLSILADVVKRDE
ncbi:DUF885 domain-containing protein [Undibacterium sp. Di27W]|uniref:DUF885 domain-containing protein n=1 Tax=Undibacterium sp. Di27W TaxID=3413036 RepID=UPI003BF0F31D